MNPIHLGPPAKSRYKGHTIEGPSRCPKGMESTTSTCLDSGKCKQHYPESHLSDCIGHARIRLLVSIVTLQDNHYRFKCIAISYYFMYTQLSSPLLKAIYSYCSEIHPVTLKGCMASSTPSEVIHSIRCTTLHVETRTDASTHTLP